jgi:hypothetical protein
VLLTSIMLWARQRRIIRRRGRSRMEKQEQKDEDDEEQGVAMPHEAVAAAQPRHRVGLPALCWSSQSDTDTTNRIIFFDSPGPRLIARGLF